MYFLQGNYIDWYINLETQLENFLWSENSEI